NRRRQIKDPVVRAAGRLKGAIDVGVNGGFVAKGLLNDFDSLSLSADVKWNVNNAHDGLVISPGVTYVTPLSRAAVLSISASAKHVDQDYADYYYTVSPAQSAASGLPQFRARGGWVNLQGGMLLGYDLDGNLLNGGFALFG